MMDARGEGDTRAANADMVDALQTWLDESGAASTDLREVVARSDSGDVGVDRLIVVGFPPIRSMPSVLSVAIARVDLVEVDIRDDGVTVTHRVYCAGRLTHQKRVEHAHFDDSLVTVTVSRLLEEHRTGIDQVSTCIFESPDRRPELAALLAGALDVTTVLSFDEVDYGPDLLRLTNRAAVVWVEADELLDEWESKHLVPAVTVALASSSDVLRALPSSPQSFPTPTDSHSHAAERASSKRVLIVSYFGSGSTPVSTQRLGYWHETLPHMAAAEGHDLTITWLSSTWRSRTADRTIFVADPGDRLIAPEQRGVIDQMTSLGLSTIGASWAAEVRRQSRSWDAFDSVIISCGPFGYLDLAQHFRELWGAKIILDFRDPLSGDGRMAYDLDARTWLVEFECAAAAAADVIVSVNDRCLDVIAPGVEKPRVAIPNGYDERTFASHNRRIDTDDEDDRTHFIYTGTIFRALPLDRFLDALPPTTCRFTHCGRDQSVSEATRYAVGARELGFVDDPIVMAALLASADAGVLLTGGEMTTQTTKVFDYIGADLDIVIVTNGQLESGALHDLTTDLDGVFWVRNEVPALAQFFSTYRPTRSKRPERELYSRRRFAESMLELIVDEPTISEGS